MAKNLNLTPASWPVQVDVGVSSVPKSWTWYNVDKHGNHQTKLVGVGYMRKPGSDITLIECMCFCFYLIIGVKWFGVYRPPASPAHAPKRAESLWERPSCSRAL